jgi:flavin-dependent dehydrogenase
LNQNSCDVVIVGGGPAGLAAAIALRMQGADVLVADALKPPIDKACGEGLMPDARRDLAVLGVHCEPGEGARFRGIRFVNWTDGEPVSASAHFASGEGVGMRRTALHARMVDRALEVGVRLRWNTHVALGSSVLLDREACRYRFLVGADGQSSRVRRWAGLDACRLISRRFGFRRHYRIPPISDFVEVHWCALGQVYITPVSSEEICVAVVTRHSSTRMREMIDAIPPLRERFPAAEAVTGERGALTTTRRLRRVVRGNVALIGDASGSVDAVTGEGLAIGFRQAGLLCRSLEKGSLDLYATEHDRTLRMPRRMARGLLMADKHSSMRNAAMRILARSPELCHGLLQVHMGEESLPHLLLHSGVGIVRALAFSGISASDTERAAT